MIYDLLDVFKKEYEKHKDKLILDNYVLKDGLYIKVKKDKSFQYFIFQNDKKEDYKENCFTTLDKNIEKKEYEWFKQVDYYSSILNDDTNKSITSARYAKVLSTNYLSFFFRHEILFEKINDKLYLKEELNEAKLSLLDQKKKMAILKRLEKRLLSFEELWEIAEKHYYSKLKKTIVEDFNLINRKNIIDIIKYIKENNINTDYIKIFADVEIDEYKRVQSIYWKDRIFNKNDFNVEINDFVYGLSNANISLSQDKPFNQHKTTKFLVPFRISQEDAIFTKKFFDWLEYLNLKKTQIFEDKKYYVQRYMENQKDLGFKKEIKDYDYLTIDIDKFDDSVYYKNYLKIVKNKKIVDDIIIDTLGHLEEVVNEVFYNNLLIRNYYGEIKKLDKHFANFIYLTRDGMRNYFKKFDERAFYEIINKYATQFVLEHLRKNRELSAKKSLNLKLSLQNHKGENIMQIEQMQKDIKERLDTNNYENLKEDEFFYLCGQTAKYLLSKSKSGKKDADMLEPFLRVKNVRKLKDEIKFTFFKYKHEIGLNQTSFNNAMSLITAYEGDETIDNDSFLVGLLSKNIFYMKKEEGK